MLTRQEPYALAHDEGQALWFLGHVLTRVKATGEQTGGAYGLVDQVVPAGFASPWHVHHAEDEVQADLLGLLTQLGVLPPLDLARSVVLARVQWTGALLADERSPAPHRAPPCTGRCSSGAPYAPPRTGTDNRSGQRFPASFHLSKCACKGASCPWCQRGEGRRMQIDGHRGREKTKPEQSHHLD